MPTEAHAPCSADVGTGHPAATAATTAETEGKGLGSRCQVAEPWAGAACTAHGHTRAHLRISVSSGARTQAPSVTKCNYVNTSL